MLKFAYNNTKNTNTDHTFFKLNCGFYCCVSFQKDINLYSKSHSAKKLTKKLKNIMSIQQNFIHVQKLQQKAYDKGVKLLSYAMGQKIWLNSKYIKTKRNCKLKNKFFRRYYILHLNGNQAYKLELLSSWRIFDIFLCYYQSKI